MTDALQKPPSKHDPRDGIEQQRDAMRDLLNAILDRLDEESDIGWNGGPNGYMRLRTEFGDRIEQLTAPVRLVHSTPQNARDMVAALEASIAAAKVTPVKPPKRRALKLDGPDGIDEAAWGRAMDEEG